MKENWTPVDWVNAHDERAQLSSWIIDNLSADEWTDSKETNFTVLFKYEQDAIAFKLKFGL